MAKFNFLLRLSLNGSGGQASNLKQSSCPDLRSARVWSRTCLPKLNLIKPFGIYFSPLE